MPKDKKTISPAGAAENKEIEKKKSLSETMKNIQIPNWMAVAIIFAVIMLVVIVFFAVRWLKNPAATDAAGPSYSSEADPNAMEVEALPQVVRNFDGENIKNPFTSDKIGNVKITGIISNSNGKSTAIVETDVTSYIVSEGDFMPESSWQVESISKNSVTFVNEGSKKIFYLNGNTNAGGQK